MSRADPETKTKRDGKVRRLTLQRTQLATCQACDFRVEGSRAPLEAACHPVDNGHEARLDYAVSYSYARTSPEPSA